jgi:Uma2 family endonuclease
MANATGPARLQRTPLHEVMVGPDPGAWTYEDYLRLPDDGRRYEILRGRLLMSPAPRPRHQQIVGRLFLALSHFLHATELGDLYFAPIDVLLPGLAQPVQPDLVMIRKARREVIQERAIVGVPDLIIEVLSPSSWQIDRRDKYELYAEAGVSEYWTVDPERRTIEVLPGLPIGCYLKR